MSKELEAGIKIGRGSLVFTQKALSDSLGKWSKVLVYLDRMSCRDEFELVAAINYILGRDIELTPTLKASIALDFVSSRKDLLISESELLLVKEYGKEEKEKEEKE